MIVHGLLVEADKLLGGYTALATKGVSSMLSSTLWRAFTTPVTYGLLLILLVTAVMQIRYVNKALQRFDSTQVIPIQFVLFTLSVILGSAILYRDFEKITRQQAVKFVGGCLLTFFGVFLITSGRQQQDDVEDVLSDEEGVEETIGLTRQDVNNAADSATPPLPSRRSSRQSRVSFADTAKLEPPSDDTDVPLLGPPVIAGSPHDLIEGESAPLLGNAWRESWHNGGPPPHGPRTLSAMTAPAAASTSANAGPSTPTRDSAHGQADGLLTPRASSCASRGSSHGRSKTFISPSPLSSTVTTVVKDAFLGGHDISRGKRTSLRRIRSSIRASLFFGDEDKRQVGGGQAAALVSNDDLARLSQTVAAVDPDDADPRQQRVSSVFGDLLRPRKMPSPMGGRPGEVAGDAETSRQA